MPKCEWCGKSFDSEEAADYFESEMGILTYSNVKKCLCGECAVQAINDLDDGVYFETCENCGLTFDVMEHKGIYADHFPWYNGTNLYDEWGEKILCAYCAIDASDSRAAEDEE